MSFLDVNSAAKPSPKPKQQKAKMQSVFIILSAALPPKRARPAANASLCDRWIILLYDAEDDWIRCNEFVLDFRPIPYFLKLVVFVAFILKSHSRPRRLCHGPSKLHFATVRFVEKRMVRTSE
jgi:hypothetical protein